MLSERQCVTRPPNQLETRIFYRVVLCEVVPAPGAVNVPDDDVRGRLAAGNDSTRGGVFSARRSSNMKNRTNRLNQRPALLLRITYFLLMSVVAILIQPSCTNMRRCPSCHSILPTRV
jgi:hypothetical protein